MSRAGPPLSVLSPRFLQGPRLPSFHVLTANPQGPRTPHLLSSDRVLPFRGLPCDGGRVRQSAACCRAPASSGGGCAPERAILALVSSFREIPQHVPPPPPPPGPSGALMRRFPSGAHVPHWSPWDSCSPLADARDAKGPCIRGPFPSSLLCSVNPNQPARMNLISLVMHDSETAG